MSQRDAHRWDTVRILRRRGLVVDLPTDDTGLPRFPAEGLRVGLPGEPLELHGWKALFAGALCCPTCGKEGALTWEEARKGYQCPACTAAEEFGA